MLIRLIVAVALVIAGASPAAVASVAEFAGSSPVAAAPAAPTPAAATSSDVQSQGGGVAFTALDVVVPPVEPSGHVVESQDVIDARRSGNAVVADTVAPADRVESAAVETKTFQTLGVTWPEGTDVRDLDAKVRTRTAEKWSGWVPLAAGDGGPDVGSPDAQRGNRGGTDSVWVGDADAVQLSFAATPEGGPDGLSLALIGSDSSTAQLPGVTSSSAHGAAATFNNAAYRTGTVRTSAVPQIISRSQWGARDPVCTPNVASALVGAVVHHTAGSNSYSTVAEAEQQIRQDQSYHIDGLGWCDIGYNFIVDKWGNIYEGRANSATQPVIGVHAGGFNTGTVGISMLGDYSSVTPPPATLDAVAQVAAWRLAAYGVNPQGSISYYTLGGENSKIPPGTTITLPTIFAHRDVAYTACPGQAGYDQMGVIRQSAGSFDYAQRLAAATSIVKSLYRDILGRDADTGGLSYWSINIVQGMSPAQVGQAFARSPEYAYATVARDYRDVLGREPDPSGISTWTSAIISGVMRSEDLNIWLYSSVEYYNISGQTDDSYVTALYRHILGREPGPTDIPFWSPLVSTRGQDAVVRGFWGSGESANVRVQAFYQRYLGRAADPQGMVTWPPILLQRGEGELRDQLVGSVEYYNRAMAAFS
jgi:hypothetical protein